MELAFQVGTRREGPAGAGDDSAAKLRLSVEPAPQRVEFCMAVGVDAIEVFWPVQADEEDVGCRKGDDTVF